MKRKLIGGSLVVLLLAYAMYSPQKPYIEGQTQVETTADFVRPEITETRMIIPKFDWKVWKWAVPLGKLLYGFMTLYESHPITFYDARRANVSYEENGFMVAELHSEVENFYSDDGQKQYEEELTDLVMKIHPEAKELIFTGYLFRGGDDPKANPAAVGSPHLDYHQNWTEYMEALEYNDIKMDQFTKKSDENDKKYTHKYILGVWKPINMKTGVCDFPFAIGDMVHFKKEDAVMNRLEMGHYSQGNWEEFKTISAAIKYNLDVKYYYYPFQTNEEVLVFRQLTFNEFKANPHMAFKNDNCPPESDTRKSIETRVVVWV